MGLAHDLLLQAQHLALHEGERPSQASLRRSVSTAYYALFHLLVSDAARRWNGSQSAVTGLERAFSHSAMKNASTAFQRPMWKNWHGELERVPMPLRSVADLFVNLQEKRHAADYDNHQEWTATDVRALLKTIDAAFQDWAAVRTEPIAGDYLLSMLIGTKR